MKFGTFDISHVPISILMYNTIFYQIFANCWAQIGPQIKNAQDSLKFGAFEILNIPISILMYKNFFMKYLRPLRPYCFQN